MSNVLGVNREDIYVDFSKKWVDVIYLFIGVGIIAAFSAYLFKGGHFWEIGFGIVFAIMAFLALLITIAHLLPLTEKHKEEERTRRYFERIIEGMTKGELHITYEELDGIRTIKRKLKLTAKRERKEVEERLEKYIEKIEKDPLIREMLKLPLDMLEKIHSKAYEEKRKKKPEGDKYFWDGEKRVKITHQIKLTEERFLYTFEDLKKEKRNKQDKREFYSFSY
ncbi:MAG: hypothetical protein ACW96U_07820 [Candidatus Heimdallarchaeaceae archaeon]|jgi:hypothetical protein